MQATTVHRREVGLPVPAIPARSESRLLKPALAEKTQAPSARTDLIRTHHITHLPTGATNP